MNAARQLSAVPATTPEPVPVPDALDAGMALVAAALRTDAATVAALPITPADLPGWFDTWRTIIALAADGINPDPVAVLGRLDVAGHRTQTVCNRLADATTLTVWPEQIHVYAHTALTAAYRAEWVSLAVSLTGAADSAPEAELETILSTHRARLLDLRSRRQQLNRNRPS